MSQLRRTASLAGLVAALGLASAPAQLPTRTQNLQVLPPETPVREVVDTMKGFTRALGVRCQHCHVHAGTDPNDLATFDFASDEKAEKRSARVMMRMLAAINDEHLPRTGKPRAELVRVTCLTCHRGKAKPEDPPPPAPPAPSGAPSPAATPAPSATPAATPAARSSATPRRSLLSTSGIPRPGGR
jgi:hypothetical protein